jgi:hypothetical protein
VPWQLRSSRLPSAPVSPAGPAAPTPPAAEHPVDAAIGSGG